MYHISDLKKYNRCERLYYLSLEEKSERQSYLRTLVSPMDLIKIKYGIQDNYFEGKTGDDPNTVLENLDKYTWFVNSRFEYNNLRCKIPLLKKKSNGKFDLYFINLVLHPKEDDVFSLAATYYVLINNGIKINDVKIIHLNDKYVRRKELNPKSLFKDTKNFYNVNGNLTKKVIKNSIKNYVCDFNEIIKQMDTHSLEDYEPIKKTACTRHTKCSMFDKCFKENENYKTNSILTLNSAKNKQLMFESGIKFLKDVDASLVEGTKQQYAQIMADKNGGLFVDKYPLKTFLEKLQDKPISFIDFEWDTYLIPPYKGMKPYDVLCFQYSCHILDEKGNITHKEFLEVNDSREAFIVNLLKDVAPTGPVVAYNAIGAEAVRLRELGEMFPKYKEQLDSIINRFVDLAYPFINGLVYDVKMNGIYSLKSLLAAISDYSYEALEIGQARLAVEAHRALEDGYEEAEKLRKELLEYCGLDTYSMIVVYNWLLKLV